MIDNNQNTVGGGGRHSRGSSNGSGGGCSTSSRSSSYSENGLSITTSAGSCFGTTTTTTTTTSTESTRIVRCNSQTSSNVGDSTNHNSDSRWISDSNSSINLIGSLSTTTLGGNSFTTVTATSIECTNATSYPQHTFTGLSASTPQQSLSSASFYSQQSSPPPPQSQPQHRQSYQQHHHSASFSISSSSSPSFNSPPPYNNMCKNLLFTTLHQPSSSSTTISPQQPQSLQPRLVQQSPPPPPLPPELSSSPATTPPPSSIPRYINYPRTTSDTSSGCNIVSTMASSSSFQAKHSRSRSAIDPFVSADLLGLSQQNNNPIRQSQQHQISDVDVSSSSGSGGGSIHRRSGTATVITNHSVHRHKNSVSSLFAPSKTTTSPSSSSTTKSDSNWRSSSSTAANTFLSTIEERIAHLYYRHGLFIARRPLITILLSLTIVCICASPVFTFRGLFGSSSEVYIETTATTTTSNSNNYSSILRHLYFWKNSNFLPTFSSSSSSDQYPLDSIGHSAPTAESFDNHNQQLPFSTIPRWFQPNLSYAYVQQIYIRSAVLPWPPPGSGDKMQLVDALRAPFMLIFELLESIQNYVHRDNVTGTEINLSDICLQVAEPTLSKPYIKLAKHLPAYSCLVLSPANIWYGDAIQFRADTNLLASLLRFKDHSTIATPLPPGTMHNILFGVRFDETGLRSTYVHNRTRTITYGVTILLRRYVPEYVAGLRKFLLSRYPLSISYHTQLNNDVEDDGDDLLMKGRSFESGAGGGETASSNTTTTDRLYRVANETIYIYFSNTFTWIYLVPVTLFYLAITVYIYYSVRKMEHVRNKPLYAACALLTVLMSVFMSFGICFRLNFHSVLLVNRLVPIFVAFFTFENIFIMTRSVSEQYPYLDTKVRVAQGLSKEGLSITKNLLAELTLLCIGSLAFSPFFQECCIFAAICLVSDFFLQLSFFTAIISTDIQRIRGNKLQQQKLSSSMTSTSSSTTISPSSFPRNIYAPRAGAPIQHTTPKRLRIIYFFARIRIVQRCFLLFLTACIGFACYNAYLLFDFQLQHQETLTMSATNDAREDILDGGGLNVGNHHQHHNAPSLSTTKNPNIDSPSTPSPLLLLLNDLKQSSSSSFKSSTAKTITAERSNSTLLAFTHLSSNTPTTSVASKSTTTTTTIATTITASSLNTSKSNRKYSNNFNDEDGQQYYSNQYDAYERIRFHSDNDGLSSTVAHLGGIHHLRRRHHHYHHHRSSHTRMMMTSIPSTMPYHHWSNLFSLYNISLTGRFITILPPILLSIPVTPSQAVEVRNPADSSMDMLRQYLPVKFSNGERYVPLDEDLDEFDDSKYHDSYQKEQLHHQQHQSSQANTSSDQQQSPRPLSHIFSNWSTTNFYITAALFVPSFIFFIYLFILLYRCVCTRNYAEWRVTSSYGKLFSFGVTDNDSGNGDTGNNHQGLKWKLWSRCTTYLCSKFGIGKYSLNDVIGNGGYQRLEQMERFLNLDIRILTGDCGNGHGDTNTTSASNNVRHYRNERQYLLDHQDIQLIATSSSSSLVACSSMSSDLRVYDVLTGEPVSFIKRSTMLKMDSSSSSSSGKRRRHRRSQLDQSLGDNIASSISTVPNATIATTNTQMVMVARSSGSVLRTIVNGISVEDNDDDYDDDNDSESTEDEDDGGEDDEEDGGREHQQKSFSTTTSVPLHKTIEYRSIWCLELFDRYIIAGCGDGDGRLEVWDAYTGQLAFVYHDVNDEVYNPLSSVSTTTGTVTATGTTNNTTTSVNGDDSMNGHHYQHTSTSTLSNSIVAIKATYWGVVLARLNGRLEWLEADQRKDVKYYKTNSKSFGANTKTSNELGNATSTDRRDHRTTMIVEQQQQQQQYSIRFSLRHQLQAHQQPITRLEVIDSLEDEDFLQTFGTRGCVITGSVDNTLKVFNTDVAKFMYTLNGHCGAIVVTSIDQYSTATALSGCQLGQLFVWDLLTGTCIFSMQAHSQAEVLAITASQLYYVSSGTDNRICIWDRYSGHLVHQLNQQHSACRNMMFLESHILLTVRDAELVVWDVNEARQLCIVSLAEHYKDAQQQQQYQHRDYHHTHQRNSFNDNDNGDHQQQQRWDSLIRSQYQAISIQRLQFAYRQHLMLVCDYGNSLCVINNPFAMQKLD